MASAAETRALAAVDFLSAVLRDGPIEAEALKAIAKRANIRWFDVRMARKAGAAEVYRDFPRWMWRLS